LCVAAGDIESSLDRLRDCPGGIGSGEID
jgi:hypothetical protein